MKKFIIFVTAITICSTASYAQGSAKSNGIIKKTTIIGKEEINKEEINTPSEEKPASVEHKEKRKEKTQVISEGRKNRVAKRKEKFKSLSLEKQKAVKSEMKRHRAEMKKITGEDFGGYRGEKF